MPNFQQCVLKIFQIRNVIAKVKLRQEGVRDGVLTHAVTAGLTDLNR
jgi:hypothetical protein